MLFKTEKRWNAPVGLGSVIPINPGRQISDFLDLFTSFHLFSSMSLFVWAVKFLKNVAIVRNKKKKVENPAGPSYA